MALELAIDYRTGDLLVSPNKDIEVRSGLDTIEQRIRVRLRIFQGEWLLDPTGGKLGSTLHDALRLPVWRAVQELPLIVKEALQEMTDISVSDVQAFIDPDNPLAVDFTVAYRVLEAGIAAEEQSLTFTTTIAG